MKRYTTVLVLLCCTFMIFGESRIIPVFIDQRTEEQIGTFPIDRSYYAKAINELAALKAKAVILKFFFDQAKPGTSDIELTNAMHKLPTIIQAGIVDERKPNDLNKRFVYQVDQKVNVSITGKSGWLPIKLISDAAYDLGFVDGNTKSPEMLPLLEKYKGVYVKSLLFSVLLYCNPKMVIKWNESLQVGDRIIKLSKENELSASIKDSSHIKYISFIDLINGKVKQEDVEGKIVYIGYDGQNQNYIGINNEKINSHRYYYLCIKDALEQFDK